MFKKFLSYKLILIIAYILTNLINACAQPGQFDSSFNGNGRAFTGIPGDQYFAHTSILQPDGKLVVAGESYTSFEHACLARYNENGSLDLEFGTGGKVKTDFLSDVDRYYTLAILKDGKIIAGGTNGYSGMSQHGILARYHSNGIVDSSFGIYGKLVTDFGSGSLGSATISNVEELPNGNLKVIGSRRIAINTAAKQIMVQVKSNGAIDSSFGTNGIVEIDIDSRGLLVGIQKDGKIIFARTRSIEGINHFEISRYFANGDLDSSFNNKGSITTAIGKLGGNLSGALVLPNDKILAYGTVARFSSIFNNNNASDLGLLQLNSDGTLDSSFGVQGIVATSFKEFYQLTKLLLQADGKVLVAGTTDDAPFQFEDVYTLARFQSNGRPDSTFGDHGKKIYNIIPGMEGTCQRMHLINHRIYLTGWANYLQAATFAVLAIQNDGIPLAPVTQKLCRALTSTSLIADISGSVFRWQLQKDSPGFVDLENDSVHTGVKGSTLILTNIPASYHGYQYRCVTDKGTSNTFTLQFLNTWTGAKSNLWEDAGNWSCGEVPTETTNAIIDFGPVVVSGSTTINSLKIKEGVTFTVIAGATLKITGKSLDQ